MGDRANRIVVEDALAAWNRGDLEAYLRLYSDDVIIHGYAGLEPGFANVRRFYEAWWTGFPGSQLLLEDLIESDDSVACRAVLQGRHRGTFQGMPPSDRPISVRVYTMLRFRARQCVERWSLIDSLALLTQIGHLPPAVGSQR